MVADQLPAGLPPILPPTVAVTVGFTPVSIARGEAVFHIMEDRIVPATLTPGAVIGPDRTVTYPAPHPE